MTMWKLDLKKWDEDRLAMEFDQRADKEVLRKPHDNKAAAYQYDCAKRAAYLTALYSLRADKRGRKHGDKTHGEWLEVLGKHYWFKMDLSPYFVEPDFDEECPAEPAQP